MSDAGRALSVMDRAVEDHRPSHAFVLFSGGYDSLVMAHVAVQHPCVTAVVHINTGIGIPETRAFVVDTCRRYGWPLKEYTTPIRYEDIVREHGFPGPPGHQFMYRRLKDRCIYQIQREHKRRRGTPILYLSGIRREESRRRMGYGEPIHRHRAQVWCNPLLDWTKREVMDYHRDNSLPRNPVVDRLHMSGECLCGAFAKRGELALIEGFYPETGRRIRDLEQMARDAGHPWGWEERPPRWVAEVKRGQRMHEAFAPLCSSCDWRDRAIEEQEIAR